MNVHTSSTLHLLCCMCAYAHLCMHFFHVCARAHACVFAFACSCLCVRVHVHASQSVRVRVCARVCVRVCVSARKYWSAQEYVYPLIHLLLLLPSLCRLACAYGEHKNNIFFRLETYLSKRHPFSVRSELPLNIPNSVHLIQLMNCMCPSASRNQTNNKFMLRKPALETRRSIRML